MTATDTHRSRGWFAGLALAGAATLGLGMASPAASGSVLVSDNFDSATDGAPLDGRSPDTGSYDWIVSGGTQAEQDDELQITLSGGDGEVYTAMDGRNQEADIQFDPGAADQYTVSATVRPQDVRYVGLGLVKGTASFFTQSQLTVQLRPSGRVVLSGPWGGADGSTTLADTGNQGVPGFDDTIYHDLELIYDAIANTATVKLDGAAVISDVAVVDKNGAGYTPILKYGTIFFATPAPDGATPSRARVDDFIISAVPEPGSMSLLTLGGLMVLRRRRATA